jgi:eight-cysteine-cluster-containing protein
MKREHLYGLLVTAILVVIGIGLYFHFIPEKGSDKITATLLVFSGRPDPTWEISDPKEIMIIKESLSNIPVAENPNWNSVLGYRGISLEPVFNESLGISGGIIVWNGIIEFSHDRKYVYYADVHGLEDWLKEKARKEGFENLMAAIQMPNPASVYCEQHGGKSKIRTDPLGNQYGVCIFPDGSECEEWAYYRGECKPGNASPIGLPNPASVYCEQHGGTLEIRTDASGGQYGVCVFPDGTECEEWAFFRGECGKSSCGNNLCEKGESDWCPPCTYASPPCLAPCISGTCPQDCSPSKLSFRVSDCMKNSSRAPATIEVDSIGGYIFLNQHLSYVCCAKVIVSYEILESHPPMIKITEKNAGEMCRCECEYDIEARLGPFEKGEYVIQIWGVEFRDTPTSLLFEKSMTIVPSDDFCGTSTLGTCSSDADCMTGGCSGQVCQSRFETPRITTCEWRDCYDAKKYGYGCKCIQRRCQWAAMADFNII